MILQAAHIDFSSEGEEEDIEFDEARGADSAQPVRSSETWNVIKQSP